MLFSFFFSRKLVAFSDSRKLSKIRLLLSNFEFFASNTEFRIDLKISKNVHTSFEI